LGVQLETRTSGEGPSEGLGWRLTKGPRGGDDRSGAEGKETFVEFRGIKEKRRFGSLKQ
jgi:hypothetical protein